MPVAGQGRGQKPYSPPRMADGHPDLQGTYDLATLTPLERPAGAKAVLTGEEAAKLEKAVAARVEAGSQPSRGDRPAPPKGGDGSQGAAGNVGGYNSFWLDPGSSFTIVNGERRTSLIVDPPDGKVPQLTPAARQRFAAALARPTSDTTQSDDPGLETAPGAYDDPERRPLGERCLLGFGSTSGPPALPNYFYNNLHKIVQTPNAVMILNEMVHDARIVRMNGRTCRRRAQVDGRLGRPLGGRHAGRGHDELHRQDPLPRVEPGSACRGALHARGRRTLLYRFTSRIPPRGIGLDRRVRLAGHRRADLRVRVPRGQLRAGERAARRQASGSRRQEVV